MQQQLQEYIDHFWKQRDIVEGCWIWNGKIRYNNKYAYDMRGTLWWKPKKKTYVAHRLAYELYSGAEIPRGLVIRHTCDNPLCINPSHLLLGTMKDNHDDMVSRNRAYYQKRTHCKYGHPWSKTNTSYIYNPTLKYNLRRCKTCHARDRKKYLHRSKLQKKNIQV